MFACFLTGYHGPADPYKQQLRQHRKEKKLKFRNPETSPFREDAKYFKRLSYFPPNRSFKCSARIERIASTARPLAFPTTKAGVRKRYIKYAILHFKLGGNNYQLSVYKSLQFPKLPEYKDLLFLPFTDLTTSESTYGGGRYMDIPLPPADADTLSLDFNMAYNPYCAYSDGWSCPIPPAENDLHIAILAGEKDFPGLNKRKSKD